MFVALFSSIGLNWLFSSTHCKMYLIMLINTISILCYSRWSNGYSTWWIVLGRVVSPWRSCAGATSYRPWPCWKKRMTSTRSRTTSPTNTSTSSTASSGSWTPTTTSTLTPKTCRDTTTTVRPQRAEGTSFPTEMHPYRTRGGYSTSESIQALRQNIISKSKTKTNIYGQWHEVHRGCCMLYRLWFVIYTVNKKVNSFNMDRMPGKDQKQNIFGKFGPH